MKSDQADKPVNIFSKGTRIIVNAAEKVELLLLTLILSAIITLASLQIMLRWFSCGGFFWIDPLLRYLVLWGGMLGAVLATSKGHHIALNFLDYLVLDRLKPWFQISVNFFSVIIAAFLVHASVLFIFSEIEFGGKGLFSLSTWIWNMIFPIAFSLICIHLIMNTLSTLVDLFSAGSIVPK